jgi:hypothetical protein
MHDRLLDIEQTVARLVVGRRPLPVPHHGVTTIDHHPAVARQRLVVQQPANLSQACLDERPVVLADARSNAVPSSPSRYANGC